MEHLFYTFDHVTTANQISEICNTSKLEYNWLDGPSLEEAPFVRPTTQWLGFDHDDECTISRDINEYPRLRGWDMRAWENGDWRNAHPSLFSLELEGSFVGKKVAAMVQSWLYFGLLESLLGKKICTSYFVRSDHDQTPLLYSNNLASLMYAWKVETWQKDEAAQDEVLEHANATLRVVLTAMQSLILWTDEDEYQEAGITRRNFPGFSELISHVAPAINRFVDVISMTRDQIHAASGDRMVVFNGVPDAIKTRNERLKARGWCSFLLGSCRTQMHDSVLDWLDGSGKQSTTDGHEACTSEGCVRNNVDTSTYVMQHCIAGCSCALVKPNLEDILDAIDVGEIPVIHVSGDPRLSLTVTRRPTGSSDYIAISHVWVDGLGSTSEVGIFACQAKRLWQLVQNVSDHGETPLWIDSLCIPSAEKQRKKAIGMLKAVYKDASKVLVIDKSIQRCPDEFEVEDLLWNITSSSWMQRLWTYQESYLAKHVVFQLSNSTFILDQEFPRSTLLKPVQVVRTSLVAHLNNIRPEKGPEARREGRQTNLGEVSSVLNWRSTSKAGDQVLAIAALLDIDSEALLSMPPEQRMKKFYLLVRDMPHDILFYDGARFTEKPFRWAPQTLMTRSAISLDVTPEGQSAKCSEDGLRGHYLIFSLDVDQTGQDGTRRYAKSAGEIYSILWDSWYQNTRGVYNGVILRTLQGNKTLSPDVNSAAEGIAIFQHPDCEEISGSLICDYAGRVTIMKIDSQRSEELRDHHPDLQYSNGNLEWKDVCIT